MFWVYTTAFNIRDNQISWETVKAPSSPPRSPPVIGKQEAYPCLVSWAKWWTRMYSCLMHSVTWIVSRSTETLTRINALTDGWISTQPHVITQSWIRLPIGLMIPVHFNLHRLYEEGENKGREGKKVYYKDMPQWEWRKYTFNNYWSIPRQHSSASQTNT